MVDGGGWWWWWEWEWWVVGVWWDVVGCGGITSTSVWIIFRAILTQFSAYATLKLIG